MAKPSFYDNKLEEDLTHHREILCGYRSEKRLQSANRPYSKGSNFSTKRLKAVWDPQGSRKRTALSDNS